MSIPVAVSPGSSFSLFKWSLMILLNVTTFLISRGFGWSELLFTRIECGGGLTGETLIGPSCVRTRSESLIILRSVGVRLALRLENEDMASAAESLISDRRRLGLLNSSGSLVVAFEPILASSLLVLSLSLVFSLVMRLSSSKLESCLKSARSLDKISLLMSSRSVFFRVLRRDVLNSCQ